MKSKKLILLLLIGLNVAVWAQDKDTHTLNGVKFQTHSNYQTRKVFKLPDNTKVFFHQHYNHGVFVVVPKGKFDAEKLIEVLRGSLLADYLPKESQEFEWKSDTGWVEKASKHDVKQVKLMGFNGESRVMLEYHQIDYQKKSVLVGYYYLMDKGAKAKTAFQRGLGGGNGAAGAACGQIISSITNEKAIDVRVGQPPPPAPAPPRKP